MARVAGSSGSSSMLFYWWVLSLGSRVYVQSFFLIMSCHNLTSKVWHLSLTIHFTLPYQNHNGTLAPIPDSIFRINFAILKNLLLWWSIHTWWCHWCVLSRHVVWATSQQVSETSCGCCPPARSLDLKLGWWYCSVITTYLWLWLCMLVATN